MVLENLGEKDEKNRKLGREEPVATSVYAAEVMASTFAKASGPQLDVPFNNF